MGPHVFEGQAARGSETAFLRPPCRRWHFSRRSVTQEALRLRTPALGLIASLFAAAPATGQVTHSAAVTVGVVSDGDFSRTILAARWSVAALPALIIEPGVGWAVPSGFNRTVWLPELT